jgi:hypothetical protein
MVHAVQAMQESLKQAVQSLMPDAAAAAVLFNTEESASTDAANTATAAAAAAGAAVTASELLPMHTAHGLMLPSQHMQQLQLTKPGFEPEPRHAQSDEVHSAYDNELQYDISEPYMYLEEPAPMYVSDKGLSADPEGFAPLPPQLPEDIRSSSSSSSSSSDVAAADVSMLELQGDVLISSRLPLSTVLLQQSITQSLLETATDVTRSMWQMLGGMQRSSQGLQLEEVEVTLESGSSSDLAAAAAAATDSTPITSSGSSDNDGDADVEISVTVESNRPRPLLSFLRAVNRNQAVLQDSLDAAAIATAVLRALGRKGSAEQQQQQGEEVPPQKLQEMVAELQAKVGGWRVVWGMLHLITKCHFL